VSGPDVLPLAGILLTAALYRRGYRALADRARGVTARHAVSFSGGLLALAVAVVPPLATLSHALFSAHMVQHLLLMTVAPPLLLYGRPARVLWAAAAPAARRRLRVLGALRLVRAAERAGRNAVVVVMLAVAALWAWHAPSLYQAALRNETVHAAEHLSMFGTGLALWRLVAGAPARQRHGQALLSVFVSGLAGAALGAVLTFSTTVLYPVYGDGPRVWGLTPLEDQQLAGSIMWIPPTFLSLAAMVALVHGWLAEAERRTRRREEAARPAGAGEAG
jgi:cytochrome c oxidase assembly factor CtaG